MRVLCAYIFLASAALAETPMTSQEKSAILRAEMPGSDHRALDRCETVHLPDWDAAWECQKNQVLGLLAIDDGLDLLPEDQRIPVFLRCTTKTPDQFDLIGACVKAAAQQ